MQESMVHQIVLPFQLREFVLDSLHNHVSGGGHLGISRTVAKVRQRYYWPQLRQDVNTWCIKCSACKARRGPNQKTGLLLVLSFQVFQWNVWHWTLWDHYYCLHLGISTY